MCLGVGGLHVGGQCRRHLSPHQLQIFSWLSDMWEALGPVPLTSLISYLWSSASPPKTSGELETSGSFLRLKTNQPNNKKGKSWVCARLMMAPQSPVHEHACHSGWGQMASTASQPSPGLCFLVHSRSVRNNGALGDVPSVRDRHRLHDTSPSRRQRALSLLFHFPIFILEILSA